MQLKALIEMQPYITTGYCLSFTENIKLSELDYRNTLKLKKPVLLKSFLPCTFWEHHACLIRYANIILKLGNMLPTVFGKWMRSLVLTHWPFFQVVYKNHIYTPSQENAWALLHSQRKRPADEVTHRKKKMEELVVGAGESSACKTYAGRSLPLHNFTLVIRIIPSIFNSNLN